MQTMASYWTIISITLAALFLFGICYALLVHWMSQKHVTGQTAYIVVGGVSMGLVAAIPTFGLHTISIMFSYFAACGLPMVIEYGIRVHQERHRDEEASQALAKEAIHQAITEADAHDGQT